MAKLEVPEVAQVGVQVGGIVHGDLLALFEELQPNDRSCFVKEMTATIVRHFDAEGNIILGHFDCQLMHC